MASNLKRRGQTFYARVGVNPKHWDIIGRREIVRSLKTRDRREAERLKYQAIADIKSEIESALASEGIEVAPSDPRWLMQQARALKLSVDREEISQDLATRLISEMREQHYHAAGLDARAPSHTIRGRESAPDSDRETVLPYAATAHRIVSEDSYMPLTETIRDYLRDLENRSDVKASTHDAWSKRLDAFAEWAGDIGLTDVTRRMGSRYVTEVLVPNGKANATNRNVVGTLVAFFNWHRDQDNYEGENPFSRQTKRFPKDSDQARAWTTAELQKLFKELPAHSREGSTLRKAGDVARISLFSGMRLNEICSLEVSDVNLEERFMVVTKGFAKNENSERQVPIHSALLPTLERLIGNRTDGNLIDGLKAAGPDGKLGKTLGNRFSEFKNARFPENKADKGFRFHGLRTTFITEMERAGVPEATVKLIDGHARQSMSYGYYSKGPGLDKLLEAVEAIKFPV